MSKEQILRLSDRLSKWVDDRQYGVLEIHFQDGKITHLRELRTLKLDEKK